MVKISSARLMVNEIHLFIDLMSCNDHLACMIMLIGLIPKHFDVSNELYITPIWCFTLLCSFSLSSEPRSSFSKDEIEKDFDFYVASRSRYEHYS